MNFHFSQGKKEFSDGHSVKFKELEIGVGNNTRLTIRIYPSNTFVTYHNDYKRVAKVLHKEPHQLAQQEMGNWLQQIFNNMKVRIGGQEFESMMLMYKQLVSEPLK